jgi:hypothetical protein
MALSNTLKVYPSGFIGSGLVGQTPAENILSIAKHLNNQMPIRAPAIYTANLQAVNLWQDVINGSSTCNTFEFKEKIIECALQAFGTATIGEWLSIQASSPGFSKMNLSFIEETILFIYGRKQRNLGVSSWCALLDCDDKDNSNCLESKIVKHFIMGVPLSGVDLNPAYLVDEPISRLILDWMQVPQGPRDLLESLVILFGRR